jgi:hypothetical protein
LCGGGRTGGLGGKQWLQQSGRWAGIQEGHM